MSQLIDRSLRSKFLPFVLNDKLDVQYWSFRQKDLMVPDSSAKIGIMPSYATKNVNFFNDDISFKQFFSTNFQNAFSEFDVNDGLKIDQLLDNIQAIQIREYTQDTRLDLIFSLVDYFKQGYQDGGDVSNSLGGKMENVQAFQDLLVYDMKNLDTCKPWKEIVNAIKNLIKGGNFDFYKDTDERKWIIDFIYALYYRLLTTTTSNVYTLPFSSDRIYLGNGEMGFETTDGFTIGGGSGLLGTMASFIAPSINITLTPIWKGIKGGSGVNFDIKFNLFNDEIEQTVRNFIFVHTLMPQNLPTQYKVFSQPPSLYDIKIEGGNRLFMCSGQFECNYKGVVRTPRHSLSKYLHKHINSSCIEKTASTIFDMINYNIIKIPDVYEITMHFKSLLPNTFNNFLFQFALNSRMINVSKDECGMMEKGVNVTQKIGDWLTNRAAAAVKLADNYKRIDGEKRDKIEAIKYQNNGKISPEVAEQINKDYSQSKQQALQEITER